MPQVALAAIGAGLTVSGTLATGFVVGFSVANAIIGGALALVASVLAKPKRSAFTAEASERTTIVRSATSPHRMIYGQAQVSGTLLFARVTGTKPKHLHLVIVLAGHECNEIGTCYFNDAALGAEDGSGNVIDGPFADHVRIKRHHGSADQMADLDLVAEVPEWTEAHRVRGRAYVYVRLVQNRDVFPTGIPNIKFDVKGRPVYDPRSDSTGWTDNPALCLRDYLLRTEGLGVSAAEIDLASVVTAANACDEAVVINAALDTQKRYTCNGSFTLDKSPISVVEEMAASMAGAAVWAMGAWELHAGVAAVPQGAIGPDDFRGAVKYRNKPGRQERFNAMRGTFIDPADHWQATDFVPVTNAYYESEDGEQIWQDVELAWCIDSIEAQRNAKVLLEDHRQGLRATLPLKLGAGLRLSVWQVVPITLPELGWNAKLFRVRDWALVPDGDGIGIDVQVQEYADAVYDWNYGEATARDLAPNTTLPDPSVVAPPTDVELSSGTGELLLQRDGTVVTRVRVDWTDPADAAVDQVEVQYRPSSATNWIPATVASAGETSVWIGPVGEGVPHDVRLRSRNIFGVHSDWVSVYGHVVVGKSAQPADVGSFFVSRQPDGTRQFSWADVPDADLAGYRIKYAFGLAGTWETMTPLHGGLLRASPWETNLLAAGEYTVGIVAVDTTGNESAHPRIIVSSLGDPRIDNAFAVATPGQAGWPGTRTNCALDESTGSLTALGQDTWDDLTTWDAWGVWPSDAYTAIVYEHTEIDLGAVMTFAPLISAFGSASPTIEINYSIDGVSYSGWGVPPASISARYMRVRATVAQAGSEIPQLFTMSILASGKSIDEEIIDSDTSTWSGSAAAGRVVPLTKAFGVVTSIQLALQNVGGAYTWEVVSKAASGPVIKIYNSSGVATDAVVDVVVRGSPSV